MGQSHRVHCEKGPAEAVLPSPAEEVQPTTGAAETPPSLNPSSALLELSGSAQLPNLTSEDYRG